MGRERRSEGQTEGREIKSPKAEIRDISAFKGEKLDTIIETAVQRILERIKIKNIDEGAFRNTLNIAKDIPMEKALVQLSEERKRQFEEVLPEKIESFKGQINHCFRIAVEKGYIKEPKDLDVFISDSFIQFGVVSEKRWNEIKNEEFYWDIISGADFSLQQYSHNHEAIFLDINHSNKVLAHEVGHALSSDKQENRSGFSKLSRSPEGKWFSHDNRWFTEAVTVLWENLSVNDGSKSASDKRDNNRDLALLIIQESDLDQDTVLKAYFGDKEIRTLVESKITERFNSTINDLKVLGYNNMEYAKKIIKGENVEITIDPNMKDWEVDVIETMAKIFSNVEVVDNREKT